MCCQCDGWDGPEEKEMDGYEGVSVVEPDPVVTGCAEEWPQDATDE